MTIKEIYKCLHDLESRMAAHERVEKDDGRLRHANDRRKEKESLRFAIELLESQLGNML